MSDPELVLGLVQIVKEGAVTKEYDRWLSFFYKQQKMTKSGSAKLAKALLAMGIEQDYAHIMISNYSVGLYSVMDILERNSTNLLQKRADLFDIYVVYANRGQILPTSTVKELCTSVEMSVLALTSPNVPVVVHMGINRSLTFLVSNMCQKETPEQPVTCETDGKQFKMGKNLSIDLFKHSAQYFANKYGDYPDSLEEAKNTKAKKYIFSRPVDVMTQILIKNSSKFEGQTLFVSDALFNKKRKKKAEAIMDWYDQRGGSPVQYFESGKDQNEIVRGCSFYNKPVLDPENLPEGVFEIARWEQTINYNDRKFDISLGTVCGKELPNNREMDFLISGHIDLQWTPLICLTLPRCTLKNPNKKNQSTQEASMSKFRSVKSPDGLP